MTLVYLNRHELLQAALAGVQRRISSIEKNRPQLHGADQRKAEWQIDIIGMIAEYAFAKYVDRHWQPATNKPLDALPGDVAHYQVRSSEWPDAHLFIHDADKDDAPFVLAIVGSRSVEFVGWAYGHEKASLAVKKVNSTYWIAQDALHSMSDLP